MNDIDENMTVLVQLVSVSLSKMQCKYSIFFLLQTSIFIRSFQPRYDLLQRAEEIPQILTNDFKSTMKSLQDMHFEIDESYSLERLASDVLLFYIDRFRFALRIIKLNGSVREKWKSIVNLSDNDPNDDDPPFYGFVRECLEIKAFKD
jgi:hypothetical protein